VIVISIPTAKPCAAVVVRVATLVVKALLLIETVIVEKTLSTSNSSWFKTPS